MRNPHCVVALNSICSASWIRSRCPGHLALIRVLSHRLRTQRAKMGLARLGVFLARSISPTPFCAVAREICQLKILSFETCIEVYSWFAGTTHSPSQSHNKNIHVQTCREDRLATASLTTQNCDPLGNCSS